MDDKITSPNEALNRAVQFAGGVSKLAALLKVAPNVVSNWRLRKQVPPDWCRGVEEAVDGQVTRYELAPDVFGPSPAQQEAA